jgi:hypothetical protein
LKGKIRRIIFGIHKAALLMPAFNLAIKVYLFKSKNNHCVLKAFPYIKTRRKEDE